MTGHYEYLVAERNRVLSSVRMSRADRARAIGKRYYQTVAKEHRISVDIKAETRTVSTTDGDKEKTAEKAKQPAYVPPKRKYLKSAHADIIDAVARAWGITMFSLLSAERPQRLARPRFAAALLLRGRDLSLTVIGRVLRRDHTSILHEIKRARELLANDPEWAALYRAAEHALDQKK